MRGRQPLSLCRTWKSSSKMPLAYLAPLHIFVTGMLQGALRCTKVHWCLHWNSRQVGDAMGRAHRSDCGSCGLCGLRCGLPVCWMVFHSPSVKVGRISWGLRCWSKAVIWHQEASSGGAVLRSSSGAEQKCTKALGRAGYRFDPLKAYSSRTDPVSRVWKAKPPLYLYLYLYLDDATFWWWYAWIQW